MTASTPTQPGLQLFTSNRLENLADKLADRLRSPLASPFLAEIIVVRNRGMERWLKLQLAERLGICACCDFSFPEAFGQRVFRAALPGVGNEPSLGRETLTWRIAQALPDLKERPGFATVRRYLGGADEPEDERKLIQLAARVANLFDQYLVFRPELILEWDAVGDPQWQAELWRAVSADARERHAAALGRKFARAVSEPTLDLPEIPERVSVFGISALAPFYLELLAGLSRHRQVNLFLLQPSQEYWGDITSPREEDRILRRLRAPETSAFDLHLEQGNPLLASLGHLGRDFLKLVLEAGDWRSDECFAEPGEDTLLHCIQSDILRLRERGTRSPSLTLNPTAALNRESASMSLEAESKSKSEGKGPLSRSDDSLQIHSCHSPLREMEVLYDRMLDWFARDPRLAPRDIVVMMPKVETYAPFVEAVFGSPEDHSRRIPFNIADRAVRRESHVIDAFLKLLAMPDTRLGSATVLAPLETAAVRERFELGETALDTLREWVRDANIRWGIDAAHRDRLGLPAFAGQTWRSGLDRLLLGHAMAGHGERLFAGILPLDYVEGESATMAGQLAEYIEQLFGLVHALEQRRRLDEWADLLDKALDTFFAVSEQTVREFQILRGQLELLRRHQQDAGFTRPIGRAALLERLGPVLEEDLLQAGFLAGGVTFCSFKPMRSIPFRIVCLVGMEDGAFPRSTQRLSFDLMAKSPRLGDRSTREDDRYLFLETLLSARERLYISYVGQSVKDNSPTSPSVLVSELLDYVELGFMLDRSHLQQTASKATLRPDKTPTLARLPAKGASAAARRTVQARDQLLLFPAQETESLMEADSLIPQKRTEPELGAPKLREHLETRHHLQAFHEDYFNGFHSQFFSYSSANCRASVSARDARRGIAPLLNRPLAEPGANFRTVTLEDLAGFFFNPAKFFLRHRLGIALADTPEELDEREPVLLDSLGQHFLSAHMLERGLAGEAVSAFRPVAQAAGELPPGAVGEVGFAQCASRAQAFAARLDKIRIAPQSPCDFSLSLNDFRLVGRFRERTASGPLVYRCGRVRARDLLGVWLLHLAANCAQPGQGTTLLCEDARREFTAPADAQPLLLALLELYWQGLRAPLKFFPKSALRFAEAERSARRANSASPFVKARQGWNGDRFREIPGERDDAAFDLCFRHEEPLDEVFAANARAIFGPALAHETRFEA